MKRILVLLMALSGLASAHAATNPNPDLSESTAPAVEDSQQPTVDESKPKSFFESRTLEDMRQLSNIDLNVIESSSGATDTTAPVGAG